VLRERTAAGRLDLTLFDGVTGADWSWSQRDEAMAERVLARSTTASGTLAVAGRSQMVRAGPGILRKICDT
jgi:hypothetical protein